MSDNNGYQAAIGLSQVESDVISWAFTITISAFSKSGNKFTCVIKESDSALLRAKGADREKPGKV